MPSKTISKVSTTSTRRSATVTVSSSSSSRTIKSKELFYKEISNLSPSNSSFLQLEDSSFTALSPGWVQGHAGLFDSPKSISPKHKRSSIHSKRKVITGRSEESGGVFKKPDTFVSPTGVKTRARRSSIYKKTGGNLLSGLSTKSRRESLASVRASKRHVDSDFVFTLPNPEIATRRKVVPQKKAQSKKNSPTKKSSPKKSSPAKKQSPPKKETTHTTRRSRSKATKITESLGTTSDEELDISPRRTRKTPSKRPLRSLSSAGKSDKKRKRSPSKSPSPSKKQKSPQSKSKSPSLSNKKSPSKKSSPIKSPSASKKQKSSPTKNTPTKRSKSRGKSLEVSLTQTGLNDSITFNFSPSAENLLSDALSSKRRILKSASKKKSTRKSKSFTSSPRTTSSRVTGNVSANNNTPNSRRLSTPKRTRASGTRQSPKIATSTGGFLDEVSANKNTSRSRKSSSPKSKSSPTTRHSPKKDTSKSTTYEMSPATVTSTPKTKSGRSPRKTTDTDVTKVTIEGISVIASPPTAIKSRKDVSSASTVFTETVECSSSKVEQTSPKTKTPLSSSKMKSILDSVTNGKGPLPAAISKKRKTTDFSETESAQKRRRFDREKFEKIISSTPRDMRLDILSGRRPELSPIGSANRNMSSNLMAAKQVTVFADKTTFTTTGPSTLSPAVSKSPGVFGGDYDQRLDEVDGDTEVTGTTQPYLFDYDTELETSNSNVRSGCVIL